MKKILFFIFITLLITATISYSQQKQKEQRLIETMKIINVEVPVRVYYKGELVDNLKKEDFKLYENGIAKAINGFNIIRKKMKVEVSEKISAPPPRYFMLIFNITDLNKKLSNSIDYVFKKILRKGDKVLVLANSKTEFFENYKKEGEQEKVVELLKKEGITARVRAMSYVNDINNKIRGLRQILKARKENFSRVDLPRFLDEYITLWKEYHTQFLNPDRRKYYKLAEFLQKIPLEKWVINFYQIEMFPKLKSGGFVHRNIWNRISEFESSKDPYWHAMARNLRKKLRDIDKALNAPIVFPAEEISRLFYNARATFHSLFIPSIQKDVYRDVTYQRITTDIENAMRKISEKTGGSLLFSGNVKDSLQKVVQKEDILYILTYAPREPDNIGKVKLKVSNPEYKLVYDNHLRPGFIKKLIKKMDKAISEIKLIEVRMVNKRLFFKISDIMIKNKEQKGKVAIRLKVVESTSKKKLFDKSKGIITKQGHNTISLNLNFSWLQKGNYTFIIEVKDFNTGKEASKVFNTTF